MERKDVIERAYQLISEPIDPNQKCAVELADIVNYKESEAGETVEYFRVGGAYEREVDNIYAADANGSLVYHVLTNQTALPLTFVGLQSKLEVVLIDEILNSKDQSALAAKKDGIIRAMDCEEIRRILALIIAVPSQEVTGATTGDDILDTIIKMKQKISNYATDYVLLVASDVMDTIEKYDKDNVDNFNYKMSIKEEITNLGIVKIVKVLGDSGLAGTTHPVIAAGTAILVGRNSNLAVGRPISFLRRKFNGEIAQLSGAAEGAVRLIDVARTPTPINITGAGFNTLGYGIFGYESIIQVLTNYRAVCWSDDILLGV
jgi:hypothetical protein